MTQNRRIVKNICLTSAGFATVALAVALWFAVQPVVGQTPTPDVGATAALTGAPTGASQTAPTNFAPISPSPNDYSAAIRDRIKQLQTTLQQTPTSAEEQLKQQQAITEMTRLQSELQRIEATVGNFAAYRQARDAQFAQTPKTDQPNAAPLGTAIPSGDPMLAGVGGLNDQFPGAARQDVLNASGLNGDLASRVGTGAALTPGEAAMLREQKDGLTQQYRQIQQTLRALQPGDEALAENLRQEQETLLSQLKEIDSRLVGAPAQPLAPIMPNLASPVAPNSTLPIAGQDSNDVLDRMQKAQQAAQLLREAGLLQLAGHVVNEIPRMSNPGFTETTLVAGSWAGSAGLSDEANNPFHTVSPKDIEGINNSINELKGRVDALGQTLADVETQLKLLTRQQVSGYVTQPQTPDVQIPATTPAVPEEPKIDEAPADDDAAPSARANSAVDDILASFAQTRNASTPNRSLPDDGLEFTPVDYNNAGY